MSANIKKEEQYEKPYLGNAATIHNKLSSKYDEQSEALRLEIVNSKDTDFNATVTYYVSYRGSDDNSGTSPDSPWQTIAKANAMKNSMPDGSAVLFERGGVYRGRLFVKSNCNYGAYGEGPKPCFYGSKRNYADESLWTKSKKYEGAWEIDVKAEGNDVGAIIFDHGVKVADKFLENEVGPKDYKFFVEDGMLYLYLSEGNPAKLYEDIEMNGEEDVVFGWSVKNIIIENFCVKYSGSLGISLVLAENLTVRYCEVGYIGGAYQNPPRILRYGNGIQFWADTDGGIIDHCWVYQCYDAGISNQATSSLQKNIVFSNNLIEYCIYPIEYFVNTTDGALENVEYSNNILRFAGLGWSNPVGRYGETYDSIACAVGSLVGWGSRGWIYPTKNFVVKDNIFDTAWKYLVNVSRPNGEGSPTLSGNSYLQVLSDTSALCIDGVNTPVFAKTQEEMEAAIAKIDPTAKDVELVK